jgi:hypothetical protein
LNDLNDILQKYESSTKVYNLIGIGMIERGQPDKAIKIFEKALHEIRISSQEDVAKRKGNYDLNALLVNMIVAQKSNYTIDETPISLYEK